MSAHSLPSEALSLFLAVLVSGFALPKQIHKLCDNMSDNLLWVTQFRPFQDGLLANTEGTKGDPELDCWGLDARKDPFRHLKAINREKGHSDFGWGAVQRSLIRMLEPQGTPCSDAHSTGSAPGSHSVQLYRAETQPVTRQTAVTRSMPQKWFN